MMGFFLWFAFSIAVGMLAGKRGRGSGTWFLISLILSPLLGMIFCLIADDLSKRVAAEERVKCPACAEMVLPDAVVCKHCHADLTPQTAEVARRATERARVAQAAQQRNQIYVAVICLAAIVGAYLIAIKY